MAAIAELACSKQPNANLEMMCRVTLQHISCPINLEAVLTAIRDYCHRAAEEAQLRLSQTVSQQSDVPHQVRRHHFYFGPAPMIIHPAGGLQRMNLCRMRLTPKSLCLMRGTLTCKGSCARSQPTLSMQRAP